MSNKILKNLLFILFIGLTSTGAFNTQGGFKSDQLREVLDSLELEIQDARRSGRDISALAMEIETVKNAIETNKQELGDPVPVEANVSAERKEQPAAKKITLPTSIIDWMIIVVGAIAVVAALLLVFLHIVQKIRRRQVKPPKIEPVKYKKTQLQPKPAEVKEKAPVAPEWVTAMRNYNSQKEDVRPASNSERMEPAPEPVVPQKAPVEIERNEIPAQVNISQESVVAPVQQSIPVSLREKAPASVEAPREKVIREQAEAVISSEELDFVYNSINNMAEETPLSEPVVKKEPPKSRGQIVREQITEAFDSGESPVIIAKKVGMSVGEVELILTLARRI